jgi:hypothetical protein
MAGTQSRYEWQFKQRLTSGGLNAQTNYLARNTSEVVRGSHGTDQETAGQSGILKGFIASVVPGTLRVTVSAGIGQLFDESITEPDSKAQWLELRASAEVTHNPGQATRDRWDVIEVQPAAVSGTAEIIDFFNPADNTFTPSVVVVQKISEAVLQIREGTPAVHPKLPAGTPGWIPIAYVFVEKAVIELDPDRVMYCRPILTPRVGVTPDNAFNINAPYMQNRGVSGGGWDIPAANLDGTLAVTMNGLFPNGLPFHLPRGTNVSLSASGNYVGGGLPVVSQTLYAYVAPPPYPAGYDASLAPRECYIVDSYTTPDLAATIPVGSRGCIVVVAGSGITPGAGPLGLPGSPANTYGIVDDFWGSVNITRAQMVYLGAAYFENTLPSIVQQRVDGGCWVVTKRKTGKVFGGALPIAAPTAYNMWTKFVGASDMGLPATARRLSLVVEAGLLTGGDLWVSLSDDWAEGADGLVGMGIANTSAGTHIMGQTVEVLASDTGEVSIEEGRIQGASADSARLLVRAYNDEVLASR